MRKDKLSIRTPYSLSHTVNRTYITGGQQAAQGGKSPEACWQLGRLDVLFRPRDHPDLLRARFPRAQRHTIYMHILIPAPRASCADMANPPMHTVTAAGIELTVVQLHDCCSPHTHTHAQRKEPTNLLLLSRLSPQVPGPWPPERPLLSRAESVLMDEDGVDAAGLAPLRLERAAQHPRRPGLGVWRRRAAAVAAARQDELLHLLDVVEENGVAGPLRVDALLLFGHGARVERAVDDRAEGAVPEQWQRACVILSRSIQAGCG
jgi:hypothetical protein